MGRNRDNQTAVAHIDPHLKTPELLGEWGALDRFCHSGQLLGDRDLIHGFFGLTERARRTAISRMSGRLGLLSRRLLERAPIEAHCEPN